VLANAPADERRRAADPKKGAKKAKAG